MLSLISPHCAGMRCAVNQRSLLKMSRKLHHNLANVSPNVTLGGGNETRGSYRVCGSLSKMYESCWLLIDHGVLGQKVTQDRLVFVFWQIRPWYDCGTCLVTS